LKLLFRGFHLRDRPELALVDIRFVRMDGGYEVPLGSLRILGIVETRGAGYRIRTVPGSPGYAIEFINLHAAFCAVEHLVQTGGSSAWIHLGTRS